MGRRRRRRALQAIAAVAVLVPIAVVVVYSSFSVSRYECEVCIAFRGREACRAVAGATEDEALRSAIDNACAQLAAGVTDTLRCSRTQPAKVECRRAGANT